ncbi:GpE family phage tail protein [Maricurvus nonylphenolicus]
MANMAAIFHWPPSEIENLTLEEFDVLHEAALERGSIKPR